MKNIFSFAIVLLLTVSVLSVAGEKKAEIKVDGMTCGGCVNKVKTSLEKADGVKSAQVSLKDSYAVVLYDDSVTDEASLRKTIDGTGYKAVDEKEEKAVKKGGCEAVSSSCCGEKK
ncbi:heavy-metal-associated domain-containing protein [candidate division KSB1 bacterium]|nr:heavy-metal-associated domain-containing protein [candidate division KSB1 bacterium]RQW03287.1 MAG: heavy-metal-associated domain-containing protein [candidate division KSB1 bacterium]